MKDDLLLVRLFIEDDAGAAHFTARAGRGGNGHDRRDALRIGARPPVANVFEIPERPRLPRHERDDLAGVETRAAAEGHDSVMIAPAIRLEPRFDVGGHRIATHVGKQLRAGQRSHRSLDHLRVAQTIVGDNQRPHDAKISARGG